MKSLTKLESEKITDHKGKFNPDSQLKVLKITAKIKYN